MYQIDSRRDAFQQEVITIDNGYHLVLASAGCGKTDILAERVARHLALGGDPQKMLCLTFTNRAARGMRERINSMSGAESANIFIGNTHRFCSTFLNDNEAKSQLYDKKSITQPTSILDENDTYAIVLNIMGRDDSAAPESLSFSERAEVNYILGVQHFFHQLRHRHPGNLLLFNEGQEELQESIKRLCGEFGVKATYSNLFQIYDNAKSFLDSIAHKDTETGRLLQKMLVAKKYEQYKQDHSLVDFDDLLLLTYDYAISHQDSIPTYNWIQIDEVQDLNPLQIAIIDLFTDKSGHVTIYLGDSQQAIFSFIGAKLQTLNNIKQRCGQNIHHLSQCYRSPRYLLDIFNKYAADVLDTPKELLPNTTDNTSAEYGDLSIVSIESSSKLPLKVIECVESYPTGRIAVIVNSNARADEIASAMDQHKLKYFKISGSDVFKSSTIQFLISHLSVLYNDMNYLAWAKIAYTLGVFKVYREARDWAFSLRKACVTPSDFIQRKGSSLLIDFVNSCSKRPYVIFDTETTGLDIANDDIVQIAAQKVVNGVVVGQFNKMMHTSREIPKMLGSIVNPLVGEYQNAYKKGTLVERYVGLRDFLEFSAGCTLIAHNLDFDYNILNYNLKRDYGCINLNEVIPECYDSLRIARLLYPDLKSFKLKSLLQIESLHLNGENTHLADADVEATVSLVNHCISEAKNKLPQIKEALHTYASAGQCLCNVYETIYNESRLNLFKCNYNIADEMQYIYQTYANKLNTVDKFSYVINFIRKEVIDPNNESTPYTQLSLHLNDLSMYHEADLCSSETIQDRIFISTVHKAKGLEFDNVIVVGVVDGIYPFFANRDNESGRKEDARRLYVAMTRAKKRLCLVTYDRNDVPGPNGTIRSFTALPSPFIKTISPMFK